MGGKCPKCKAVITNAKIETMQITEGFRPMWKGVAFVCPGCTTILSVGIDPLALKADMVSEIVQALRQVRRKTIIKPGRARVRSRKA